ncbi:MAG: O-antigen ligase family protein [Verrucomicrobiota bacterium]|nr:O-antigen ligase family protein [Verrucomicrobiota bacterium]
MPPQTTKFRREYLPLALTTLALLLIQGLIGGRRLLFALPAYSLIAIAVLGALAFLPRKNFSCDGLCIGSAVVFIAYIVARSLTSAGGYYARPDLYCALGSLALYLLVATSLSRASLRMALVITLLAFASVHVFVGLIQFTRGDNFMLITQLQRADYGQRASGFYVCPNHLAGLLEVLALFGLSVTLWSRISHWLKLFTGYLTAVCFAGIALTGSRGGYLSVLGGVTVFAVLSVLTIFSRQQAMRRRSITLALGLVAATLFAGLLLIHQSEFLQGRAQNLADSRNVRLQLWQAAITQWKLEPLLGTGSGTYRFYGREFRNEAMQNDPIDVHNDYLHLLCEYGIVGFAGFLLFFGTHLYQGAASFAKFRRRHAEKSAWPASNRFALNVAALSSLSAYVIHSFFDFNLHIPANALLLSFVFAVLAEPGMQKATMRFERFQLSFFCRATMAVLALVILLQTSRLLPGEYFTERARLSLRDENPAATIEMASKALRYEQNNPEIYFYRGRAFAVLANRLQGDAALHLFDEAIRSFQIARQLAPLDVTYSLDLAFTYDSIGRFEQAESMYAKARLQDPHSMAVAQLYDYHRNRMHRASSK